MNKLEVFRLSEIALPAAWLVWSAGFLPGALVGINGENTTPFQAAVVAGLLLAAMTWFGLRRSELNENSRMQSSLLALLVVASVAGMLLGSVKLAMLIAVLVGLAWWDLADFSNRLRLFDRQNAPEVDMLVRAHLNRLLLALGLGLASGIVALSIHIKLTLVLAMALSALAVLLIRQGVERFWKR